jgi:hypothetical protein
VGEVKARVQPLGGTPADGKFIRPAREALILPLGGAPPGQAAQGGDRAHVARNDLLLQVEGPFVVAVRRPKGDTALWDLARDHYGSRVKITPVADSGDVLNAVELGKATVGILPMPRLGERSPWWPQLLAKGESVPHVMGRLPFGDIGNVRDPKAEAMVVGRAPNEPTGDDRSWVALTLKTPRSRRAILAAAKALQPDAHLCLDRTSKSREWLLDVAGFAGEVEGAIAALGEALGAEARVLGSYASPLPAAALADHSSH